MRLGSRHLATMEDARTLVMARHDPRRALAVVRRIAWVGPRRDLLPIAGRTEHDGKGAWSPGLLEAHHLFFGRPCDEFEMRLAGTSTRSPRRVVARSTVLATRAASEDALWPKARPLCDAVAEASRRWKIQSATARYRKRLKMCAPKTLGRASRVEVKTTFLAPRPSAGVLRPADDYLAAGCDESPEFADTSCNRSSLLLKFGFTSAQTARVFDVAKRYGLPVKLHADQLSDLGGAQLAARYRALSADHLEHTSVDSVRAMAGAGTAAVLLPGAFYFLRDVQQPPIAMLRHHRVPMAIATDCNPGTSPCTSLLLMLNMACTLFRLTPAEALAGVTRNAAKVLA